MMKVNVTTEIEAATETGSVEVAREKRMVDVDVDERSGKTVVVGVRLDKQSKELLTWTLVNVAEAGDQVVALHVVAKSKLFNGLDSNSDSISRDFDSMLGAYEGFCNLKQVIFFLGEILNLSFFFLHSGVLNEGKLLLVSAQIHLKLKICQGSSIRKVLVREVKGFGADKVITGVTKSNSVIG